MTRGTARPRGRGRARNYNRRFRLAKQRRKSKKHPRLRPSHVGSPNRARTENPVVEESAIVPHMIHGPLECRARHSLIRCVTRIHFQGRDDALRHGMNVDGKSRGVKISCRAVLAIKIAAIELESALYVRLELG